MSTWDSLIRLKRLAGVVIGSRKGCRKRPPLPYMMVVEVTNRCNARCGYCDCWETPASARKTEMSAAEYTTLLGDAHRLGVRFVSFSGGEPLLRDDFLEIARTAQRLGFRTALNTNGYLVSATLARDLTGVLDSVTVSIDSSSEEVMAVRRGSTSALRQATRGLEYLLEARQRAGQIRVNAVVDNENSGGLGELAAHLRTLDVPLLLQPLHREGIFEDNPSDGTNPDSNGNSESFTAFAGPQAGLSRLEGQYLKPFYQGFEAHLAGRPPWFRCFAGSFAFHVTPEGDVIVCQTQREPLGNVRETSLREIWLSMAGTRRRVSADERACSCWLLCSTVNYLHADRLDRVLKKLPLGFLGAWWRGTKRRASRRSADEVPADQATSDDRL